MNRPRGELDIMRLQEKTTTRRPVLNRLARALGVMDRFVDATRRLRVTRDGTREAIALALGFDASSEAAAKASLHGLRRADHRALPPHRVVWVDDPALRTFLLERVPAEGRGPGRVDKREARYRVELAMEDGRVTRADLRSASNSGRTSRRVPLSLPTAPPPGYHDVTVTRLADGAFWRQRLIVAPDTCYTATEALRGRRGLGVWTHLYSLRGEPDRGVGDMCDLRELTRWAARCGADFVGLNPLHALWNRQPHVSPYAPLSRLFRNPLYIDLNAVPEARFISDSLLKASTGKPNRSQFSATAGADDAWVDYDAVWSARRKSLKAMHRVFRRDHGDGSTARARACARYVAEGGRRLLDFATFMALAEVQTGSGNSVRDSGSRAETRTRRRANARHDSQAGGVFEVDPSTWPAGLRSPHSPEVEVFRRERAEEIDFHCYLQFELDRQLGSLQSEALARGMGIGLYHDLAIGSARSGFDVWSRPDLFVPRMSLGCPPDAHSDEGQNWNFPPMNPRALLDDRFEPWVELLRANMSHGGMLRIDHVMGLFRQFWIPEGMSAVHGAYVRFPVKEMLGVLALESVRHRVVIVGEDLGTVPPEVPRAMKQRGLLSTRVLYFEKSPLGPFKRPSVYAKNAMAMLTTHDLPSLSAFLGGSDLELRDRLGMFSTKSMFRKALRERDRDLERLLDLLDRWGWDAAGPNETKGASTSNQQHADSTNVHSDDPACACDACHSQAISYEALVSAAYSVLCKTPCELVAISLDDLCGEVSPVNIPGTIADQFANWSRRMGLSVSEIVSEPGIGTVLRDLALMIRPQASGKSGSGSV